MGGLTLLSGPAAQGFLNGLRAAVTSVFAYVLIGNYIGIGALAYEFWLQPELDAAVDRAGVGRARAGDPDLDAEHRDAARGGRWR